MKWEFSLSRIMEIITLWSPDNDWPCHLTSVCPHVIPSTQHVLCDPALSGCLSISSTSRFPSLPPASPPPPPGPLAHGSTAHSVADRQQGNLYQSGRRVEADAADSRNVDNLSGSPASGQGVLCPRIVLAWPRQRVRARPDTAPPLRGRQAGHTEGWPHCRAAGSESLITAMSLSWVLPCNQEVSKTSTKL